MHAARQSSLGNLTRIRSVGYRFIGCAPLWVAISVALATARPALGQTDVADNETTASDRRCLACHGRPHIAELTPTERLSMVGTWLGAGNAPASRSSETEASPAEAEARPGLFVEPRTLVRSAHPDITCVECHPDAAQLPHLPELELATCAATCHAPEAEQFAVSKHATALFEGVSNAPSCSSCHGGHEILPVADRQSRQHRLNSIFLCADCHTSHIAETPGGHNPKRHMEAYFKSIHGKAVVESGLVAAPTCVDCHSAHAVHPTGDDRSPVSREHVPATCGSCHVGILEIYERGIHGQMFADGNTDVPVCTDCHKSHEIVPSAEVEFKLHSDERCGHCHDDRLERYRETFHGKALVLGMSGVAACHDCHGHHDIMMVNDPGSPLNDENRLATCQKCHPSATAAFTQYIAHADHYDREHYPVLFWTFVFMTSIVVGTFAFFALHTLLWVTRTITLIARDPRAFRDAKAKIAADEVEYVRFRPFDRFLHAMVIVSFLLLVATGMPLKFYDTPWAKVMVDWAGGLDATAGLHRLGAVITFMYFALHLAGLAKTMIRNRGAYANPKTGRFSLLIFLKTIFGPDTPMPSFQDVRDFIAHQKWFFGRGPRPDFDRWTYWEKFDYFAVFWGVAIIGISGLIMWFPELATRIVPGWSINVALIVHSDEALLAAGFIFTFHFFNVHFRPEKFPIDPVIFSGRISRAEMLHERKRWYDRLVATNKLESIRVRDDWAQWKVLIQPLGMLAFGTGLVLLLMILFAMSLRLIGGYS